MVRDPRDLALTGRMHGATPTLVPSRTPTRHGGRSRPPWLLHSGPSLPDLLVGVIFALWFGISCFSVSLTIGSYHPYKPILWLLLLLAFVAQTLLQRRNVCVWAPGWPLALLGLGGALALVYTHRFSPLKEGYGSALILFLGAIVLANSSFFARTTTLRWNVVLWSVRLLSAALVVQGLLGAGDFAESGHLPSYVTIAWILLAVHLRHRVEIALAIVCGIVVLALRPSSTLVIALALSQAAWFTREFSLQLCCRMAATAVLVVVLASLGWYLWPQLAEQVQEFDKWYKTEQMDGMSNANTRNDLLQAAREQFADRSVWWGAFFVGPTNPDIYPVSGRYDFDAPVHSDIVLFFQQGGIIGLVMWIGAYLLMLICIGRLPRRAFRPNTLALVKGGIWTVPIFVFYVSANPLMMEYQLTFAWYCISAALLSETRARPLGSLLRARPLYARPRLTPQFADDGQSSPGMPISRQ